MRPLFALIVAALLTPCAAADVITVIPSRDNTLFESATGGLSNGAGPSMYSGRTNNNLLRRAVMFFKLDTSIPAGSTINSVSLVLNVTQGVSLPTDYSLQRLLANWGEGTSNSGSPGGQGAPSTAGDATWIHTFFNSSTWATPGGDFSASVSALTTITANTGPFTWSSATMRTDVQNWVNSAATNFGWILRSDEATIGDAARFASRENATIGLRPALTINFTPVPEPTSIVLVGLMAGGGFSVRRWRRRTR